MIGEINLSNSTEHFTKEFLVQEHIQKQKTIRQIARENHCSHTTVRKHFKKHGLISHTSLHGNRYGETLVYDRDYFQSIDSPEKAYWFGFLYADGSMSITDKQKSLRFLLSISDKEAVEAFSKSIGGVPVRQYKEGVYVSLSSKKICDDVISKNMTFPKCNRTGIPDIPDEFFYSFLLGLFDGDGTFCVSNSVPTFSLLGHEELLLWIKDKLLNDGFVFRSYNIAQIKGIHRLSFSSKQNMPLIYEKLYSSSFEHFCLIRKQQKFKEYLSY